MRAAIGAVRAVPHMAAAVWRITHALESVCLFVISPTDITFMAVHSFTRVVMDTAGCHGNALLLLLLSHGIMSLGVSS